MKTIAAGHKMALYMDIHHFECRALIDFLFHSSFVFILSEGYRTVCPPVRHPFMFFMIYDFELYPFTFSRPSFRLQCKCR